MGEDLFKSIKSILVERHIMHEHPITQHYMLSNSGKAFFEELMMDFSAETEPDERCNRCTMHKEWTSSI